MKERTFTSNHFQIPLAADLSLCACGLDGHVNTPVHDNVDCKRCRSTKIYRMSRKWGATTTEELQNEVERLLQKERR